MNVRHAATIAFVASIAASAATVLAQQSTEPTGHRHKLRRVPPLPHPPLDGNTAAVGAPLIGLSTDAARGVRRRARRVREHRDSRGRTRPDLQQHVVRGVPLGAGQRRRAYDHRDAVRPVRRWPFRSARRRGRLAAAAVRDRAPEFRSSFRPHANVVAHRITTPLFGAGLLEAIPDAEIQLNARRAEARRRERTRRVDHRRRHRHARASAASAGRRSTRVCSALQPTRTSTRWA